MQTTGPDDKASNSTDDSGDKVIERSVQRRPATGIGYATKEEYEKSFREYWEQYVKPFYDAFPSAQTVSNILIAAFTFCLVFIGYVTERPQIVVRETPLQNFVKGGKTKETVIVDNIGHQTAYEESIGIAIGIFPYPLGHIRLTEMPTNSLPQDVYPTIPVGMPISLDTPLSDSDFEAISKDGGGEQIYIWGTIHYRDFAHIWHQRDFCFAYGGPDATREGSNVAGACSVSKPQQYYRWENDEQDEPHAEPMPAPMSFPSAANPR